MNHKNEQGYSLIGVLLIITIVAIVGTSLAAVTLQSVKTSTKERDNQAVYYIAEAGINYLTKEFEEAVLEAYHDESVKKESDFKQKLKNLEIPEMWDEFESVNNDPVFAKFHMNKVNETEYNLISTGFIGSETRAVSRVIEVKWEEKYQEIEEVEYKLPPFAVFTSGQFKMNNGTIIGDIGTIYDNNGAISFPDGGPNLNGDIYVPDGRANIVNNKVSKITATVRAIDSTYSIPDLPEFPTIPSNYIKLPDRKAQKDSNSTFVIENNNLNITNYITNGYTLKLDDNVEFNKINLNENNNLYINLNGKDRSIVVNHLDLTNGHIKLIGNHTLTIYVRDKITMGSGSTLNDISKINKLNIFYKGTTLNLAGDQKIYGSLYAEKANLDLTGSGGIYGNIFSGGKEIKMAGGSEIEAQLILAPKATVTMSGGGSIKGRIMSKEYNQTGGATVKLEEPFILTGPISPNALGMSNNENEGQPGHGNGNNIVETGNKPKVSKEKVKEISN